MYMVFVLGMETKKNPPGGGPDLWKIETY